MFRFFCALALLISTGSAYAADCSSLNGKYENMGLILQLTFNPDSSSVHAVWSFENGRGSLSFDYVLDGVNRSGQYPQQFEKSYSGKCENGVLTLQQEFSSWMEKLEFSSSGNDLSFQRTYQGTAYPTPYMTEPVHFFRL